MEQVFTALHASCPVILGLQNENFHKQNTAEDAVFMVLRLPGCLINQYKISE